MCDISERLSKQRLYGGEVKVAGGGKRNHFTIVGGLEQAKNVDRLARRHTRAGTPKSAPDLEVQSWDVEFSRLAGYDLSV